MSRSTRSPTTVALSPRLAKAAARTARATGRTVTDLANQGLDLLLAKREAALKLVKARRHGAFRDYDALVAELKRDGLL
jgi:hypothetical protein